MKKSLSEVQLTDRTSIVISEESDVISEAINKLKSMRAEAARKRMEVEQRRKKAMEEAERNELRYKNQVQILIFHSDFYLRSPDGSVEGEHVSLRRACP